MIVPMSSSVNFSWLSGVRARSSSVTLLPGVDHSLFLLSIMKGEQGPVLREILNFVQRVADKPASLAMQNVGSSKSPVPVLASAL